MARQEVPSCATILLYIFLLFPSVSRSWPIQLRCKPIRKGRIYLGLKKRDQKVPAKDKILIIL